LHVIKGGRGEGREGEGETGPGGEGAKKKERGRCLL